MDYIKTKEPEQKTQDIFYNSSTIPSTTIGQIFFTGWKNVDKTMPKLNNAILKILPLKIMYFIFGTRLNVFYV